MEQKLYTQADINKILTWVDHKYLPEFMEKNGIIPVQVIRTAKRIYRAFDDAGLEKAKQVATAHKEAKLAAAAAIAAAKTPELPLTPEPPDATQERLDAIMAKLDAVLTKLERVCEIWEVK